MSTLTLSVPPTIELFHLRHNLHRSFHTLANLSLLTRHLFCVSDGSSDRIMDIHIQCSIRYHDRQRITIYVCPVPGIKPALRSTVKEDLGCSPAELVPGTTLRLPGEMISNSQDRGFIDPASYSVRLKEHFRSVPPTPACSNDKPIYFHEDLSTCPFVFFEMDTVKKLLQIPYDGPYRVLKRKPKYFILDRNGTKDSVIVDRLKPSYLESPLTPTLTVRTHLSATQHSKDTTSPLSLPPLQTIPEDTSNPIVFASHYTRCGRKVTFPTRLADYVQLSSVLF
nr:hypothetical transcript [Hymenolepis microstoma]